MSLDPPFPTDRHRPRVGSLCTGYGGLDLAVEAVLGGQLQWYAETDRHAHTVLTHRFPGIPNLGDIRTINWQTIAQTAPVDVLTAGFPCQDISNAGKRAGITGQHSGLWNRVADAVRVLRPQLVFVENVAALLRRGLDVVHADLATLGYDTRWLCLRASDIGAAHRRDRLFLLATPAGQLPAGQLPAGQLPAGQLPAGQLPAGQLAAGGIGPVRTLPTPCARDGKGPGMQRGLPDLIESGGHGNTLLPTLLPALLPTPTPTAAATGSNRSMSPGAARRPGLAQLVREQLLPTPTAGGGTGYLSGTHRDTWRPSLESAVRGFQPTRGGRPTQSTEPTGALLPTPTVADSRSSANATAGRSTPLVGHAGRMLTDAARLLPTPRATDGAKGCPGQRGSHGELTLPSVAVRAAVRVLPTPTASDGRGPGGHGDGGTDLRTAIADLADPLRQVDEGRWGFYAAAVARWQVLLGRPVPEPTRPGQHGKPVLAPAFVEWLMGLPSGWVTDLRLPRTLALRILGNGVVPQQAAVALRLLLCPHRWAVDDGR